MTPILPRLKPDPLPPIHPLPERLATGARARAYHDCRTALGVPWMGVVTMAFSHYPRFWGVLWDALSPVACSSAMTAAANRLRMVAEASVPTPPPLAPALAEHGFDDVEIDQIRDLIEVFSQGNQPYLLIAAAARLGLEGHAIPGNGTRPDPAETRAGTARTASAAAIDRLVLMERHHADPATVALYDRIQATLGLPFVNTDYRALARWPAYFSAAWNGIEPLIGSAAHSAAVDRLHTASLSEALALPGPGGPLPEALTAAAAEDTGGNPGEVLTVVRLFQWLLPGLAANVAMLRVQLA